MIVIVGAQKLRPHAYTECRKMLDAALDVVEMQGTVRITGKVIARNMTYEEFLATDFKNPHVEWVNGVVIQMASIDERHDALVQFFRFLFNFYLEQTGGGRVLGDPMVMKLDSVPSSRAPDIQVLLPERIHLLKKNQVVGPANLVVEVVSPGSQRQDRIDKYREYELGGVPEYWIVDPAKKAPLFYQLNDIGIYEVIEPDSEGVYHSRALQRLRLQVEILWQEELPSATEVLRMVEAMLGESK
jgi:Uma2 family endonuclease